MHPHYPRTITALGRAAQSHTVRQLEEPQRPAIGIENGERRAWRHTTIESPASVALAL